MKSEDTDLEHFYYSTNILDALTFGMRKCLTNNFGLWNKI